MTFCAKRSVELHCQQPALSVYRSEETQIATAVIRYSQVHHGDQKDRDDLSVPVDEMITMF